MRIQRSPFISHCTFNNNLRYGIFQADLGEPTITRCEIHNNGQYGYVVYDWYQGWISPYILLSNIYNNGFKGVYTMDTTSSTFHSPNIEYTEQGARLLKSYNPSITP